MNSREIVLKALNHEEPDRVPIDIGVLHAQLFLIEPIYKRLLQKYNTKCTNFE